MATLSTSLCAPSFPELFFLSPNYPSKRLKLSLFGPTYLEPRTKFRNIETRIKSARREESSVLDEKDRELFTKLNGSVNGHVNGDYSFGNGSVENYSDGSVNPVSENGSLDKYVNGNGRAAVRSEEEGIEVVKPEVVITHKKTIEEIGQEEAWFKQRVQDQVDVFYHYYYVPGSVHLSRSKFIKMVYWIHFYYFFMQYTRNSISVDAYCTGS